VSHAEEHPTIPRAALAGAAALVVVALLGAAGARLTGIGDTRPEAVAPAATRDLRFADQADGGIAVLAAGSGARVARIAPGDGGFVRGVLRGLNRARMQRGVDAAPPFRLILTRDKRLLLLDPATGRRINLGAFGPTNARAFARLMTAGDDLP